MCFIGLTWHKKKTWLECSDAEALMQQSQLLHVYESCVYLCVCVRIYDHVCIHACVCARVCVGGAAWRRAVVMEPESPAAQLFSQCIVNITAEPSTHAQPELHNLFLSLNHLLFSAIQSLRSQSESSQRLSLSGFVTEFHLSDNSLCQ